MAGRVLMIGMAVFSMMASPNVAEAIHGGACHDSHLACVINAPAPPTAQGAASDQEFILKGWLSYHEIPFSLEFKPNLSTRMKLTFNNPPGLATMLTDPSLSIRRWAVYDFVMQGSDAEQALATGVPPPLAAGAGSGGVFPAKGAGIYSVALEVSLTADFYGHIPGTLICTDPAGHSFGTKICKAVPVGGGGPDDGLKNPGTATVANPEWVPGRFDVTYTEVRPWCVALNLEAKPVAPELQNPDELVIRPKNVDPSDPGNVKSKLKVRLSGATVPGTLGTAYLGMWVDESGGGHEEDQHIQPRPVGTLDNDTFVFFKSLMGNVDVTTIYTASEMGGEGRIGAVVSDVPFQASSLPLNTPAARAAARSALIEEVAQFRQNGKACLFEQDQEPMIGFAVRVPNLELLPDDTNYVKVGGTLRHKGPTDANPSALPDHNHLGTPEILELTKRIAMRYASASFKPPGTKIRVNDMSLPSGGRFDLTGKWSQIADSHTMKFGHANGRAADITYKVSPPISVPFIGDVFLEPDMLIRFVLDKVGLEEISLTPGTVFQSMKYFDEHDHFHVMK